MAFGQSALRQLEKLYDSQPEVVESAIGSLLAHDERLRWALVVSAYQDREINLGKAAELLGRSEIELRDRFCELGIPLRLGPADLAEARAEVDAFEAWVAKDSAGQG